MLHSPQSLVLERAYLQRLILLQMYVLTSKINAFVLNLMKENIGLYNDLMLYSSRQIAELIISFIAGFLLLRLNLRGFLIGDVDIFCTLMSTSIHTEPYHLVNDFAFLPCNFYKIVLKKLMVILCLFWNLLSLSLAFRTTPSALSI